MVEWGGHHGGWGGFGPPSYIVKKCPDLCINRPALDMHMSVLENNLRL